MGGWHKGSSEEFSPARINDAGVFAPCFRWDKLSEMIPAGNPSGRHHLASKLNLSKRAWLPLGQLEDNFRT